MTVAERVVFEDNHLLIINKPCGILVQGDKTGDKSLLDYAKEYIKIKYNKPGLVYLQPVNRIDRVVSGLVVYARTSKAISRMNEIFKERKVIKIYAAISRVIPEIEKGEMFDYILKDESTNIVKRAKSSHPKAKKAHTKYELLNVQSHKALMIVQPVTGRSHQIRAQMAWMGCPLMGDNKYGDKTALEERKIGLHSLQLSFEHPVKKVPLSVSCLPDRDQMWVEFLPILKAYVRQN